MFYGYIYSTSINYVVWSGTARTFTILFNIILFCWALLVGLIKAQRIKALSLLDIIVICLFLTIIGRYGAAGQVSGKMIFLFLGILIPYLCARTISLKELNGFLKWLYCFGAGVFLIGLVCLPSVWRSWEIEAGRPLLFGSRANTVITSGGVGSFLVMTFAYILRPKSKQRFSIVMWLLIPIALYMLIEFSGKTTLITAILIGIGLGAFAHWVARSFRIAMIWLFLGSSAIGIAMAPEYLIQYYSFASVKGMYESLSTPLRNDSYSASLDDTTELGVDDNNTMAVRIVAIRNALEQFVKNPAFGYGPDRYMVPHSTVVQVFCEYGGFAGIVFVVLILRVLKGLLRISFDMHSPIQNEAWIVMALYLYIFIDDQLLGSVANMGPFMILNGVAVSMFSLGKWNNAHNDGPFCSMRQSALV